MSTSPSLCEVIPQETDISKIYILNRDGVHSTDFIVLTFYQGAWSAHFTNSILAITKENSEVKCH